MSSKTPIRATGWLFIAALSAVVVAACVGELETVFDDELADEFDGSGLPLETPLPAGTALLGADADAHVRSGKFAATNFGASRSLYVDANASRTELQAFLRFSLPTMQTFKAARLRLFVSNTFREPIQVVSLGPAQWGEATLTFNTRPAGGALVGSFPPAAGGTWIELDVTAVVASGQPITFRLHTNSPDGAGFNSREATANRPELRVVIDGNIPPLPSTDGGTSSGDAGMESSTDAGSAPLPSCVDAGTPGPGPLDAGTAPADAGVDVVLTSFSQEIQPIFNARCTICHGAGTQFAGLNLALSAAWSNLVNVATSCSPTVPRVRPGDPAGSMLWRKLADAPDKCGSAMPATASLKTTAPAEFDKIETWISQGAMNN